MHRLLVSYPPPADPDAFLAHYTARHLPLARALPGLLGCRWMRPQPLGPAAAGTAAPPFLLFEADFASAEALFAALGSPAGEAVAADVPRYSPGGATLLHYEVPA
ncbi:EthD family reductase [Piscinibacter sakaiensis]|uniref:Putative ethyl tert-butyl ether degradation protein n=1 Tax=Piscinibacter sakaiensis TaxID=1547922 RepID=A0A0K8P0F3_PISS1|nr:EthD family reductase [Piscinibacter sakaiensis]GAP36024.1 putative ethyl tert-butyl ether degradation protein [Piscinibacter sakaiensis]